MRSADIQGNGYATSLEAAADWFLRVRDDDISGADLASWQDWIEADASNARAFDEIVQLWGRCDALDALPWPDGKELAEDNYDPSGPVPVGCVAEKPRRLTRRGIVIGMAAMAAGIALAVVTPGTMTPDSLWSPVAENYETRTAEHREIALSDGSNISLGAMTRISVEMTATNRRLVLHQGEALFEVAKDAARPFLVTAGPSTVRAVGTAFNIKIGLQNVIVTVVEGEVQVTSSESTTSAAPSAVAVFEGQKVDYDVAGSVGEVENVDVALATMWKDGRLTFIEQPLETVVADVNRYSEQEIIVADEEAKMLMFTGTVFQKDVDNWLAGLERGFPIRIVNLGEKGTLIISDSEG